MSKIMQKLNRTKKFMTSCMASIIVVGIVVAPICATSSANAATKSLSSNQAFSKYRQSVGSRAVTYGRKFMGTRYVYGGSSPRGFDCSGFTCFVYRRMGIKLPRTARAQASRGKKISRSALRRGDLVFFHTLRTRTKVNHVGIYAGNNKFIHASSGTRKIRVSNLSDAYFKKAYVMARRVA